MSTTTPTLGWGNVANESGYVVRVFAGGSCSGTAIHTSPQLPANTTSYVVPAAANLQGGQTYSWQVQAKGNGTTYCDSSWSSCCSFSVSPPSRVVRVVASSGSPGGTVGVPIELAAQGDENTLGFSLVYDPSVLTYVSAVLGANAVGGTLYTNPAQAASGRVGIAVGLPPGKSFSSGNNEVVVVNFSIASGTSATSSPLGFGDQPISREIAGVGGTPLTGTWTPGTVSIGACAGYEADVAPRPGGNGSLTMADWVQVGRFAAGLDTPSSTCESQKADCAPKPCGNGSITMVDWVQAGRYAAALDTPVSACAGGTKAAGALNKAMKPSGAMSDGVQKAVARQVTALDVTIERGQTGVVAVQLAAQGDENAVGFSLSFDTALLVYAGASLGSGASGAMLNVNTNQLAAGRVGFGLTLPTEQTFPAGNQSLLEVSFTAEAGSGTVTTVVSFGDQPVEREIVDTLASTLSADYTNASVTLTGQGPVCVYTLAPTGTNIGAGAMSGSFAVNTASGCAWAASTPDNWIHTTSTGTGPGSVSYTVDANTGAGSRVGTIAVQTQSFNITQAGASPPARVVAAQDATIEWGQTGVVAVQLAAQGDENAVGFSLSFDTALLAYEGASLGSGAAGALFNVNTNQLAAGRVGFGLTLPTEQTFPAGNQSLVQVSFRALAGSGTVTTMVSFGDQPVEREIADALASPVSADYTNASVTLTGQGPVCVYTLAPTGTNIGAGAMSGSFAVNTTSGCAWAASTPDNWIHTTSAGTDSGTVSYTVDANTSTSSRSGTIAVQDQTFTITQTGTPPTPIIGLLGDLAFGNVSVGSSSNRSLTITNYGNATLNVSNLTYLTPVFSGQWSGAIPAGGSASVTVTFAPAAEQSYTGLVTVVSDATTGQNSIGASGVGVRLPQITQQPQSQTLCAGGTATLAVTATGTAPLNYQWFRNGAPAGTGNPLVRSNVSQNNDQGSYVVTVSNGAGSVTSAAATLTVNTAPQIVTPPASATVSPGATVQLSVAADGTAPLNYQWRKNGADIAGQTTATLIFQNVQASNAGTYTVRVSNTCGSTNSPAAVLAVGTVGNRALAIASSNTVPGGTANVPVTLVCAGNENRVAFSVALNHTAISAASVTLGSGAPGAALTTSSLPNGNLLVDLALPGGAVFSAGTREVAVLHLTATPAIADDVLVALDFGDVVQVTDSGVNLLPAATQDGVLAVRGTTAARLNPGTGLFEKPLVLAASSAGLSSSRAFLALINGLGNDSRGRPIQVYNQTGLTNGAPYLLVRGPVSASALVNLAVQYIVLDRVAVPRPAFAMTKVQTAAPSLPNGTPIPIQSSWITSVSGQVYLQFPSRAGRTYYIQYAPTLNGPWSTAYPPMTGNGAWVIWVDAGPPCTESSPASTSLRFYRAWECQ